MPYNLSVLNNATFDAEHSSLLLTLGDGLTQVGGTYVASPTSLGLANSDNDAGTFNNPLGGDTVSVNTFLPAVQSPNVLEYTITSVNNNPPPPTTTSPSSGGIGAELIATNSTGYLFEQLSGYVPGPNAIIDPDGQYFILTSVNIATTDGNGNPIPEGATTAQLTFGVPEPSTAMLMPVMVVALMLARVRSVRAFLRSR